MIIACASCEALVDAEQVGQLRYNGSDEWMLAELYTLLKCPRCGRPLLAFQNVADPFGGELEWDEPTRLYPAPDRQADNRLPTALHDCFQEALGCVHAKHYNSAALMCRKTLEGICQLKGASSGSLARGLMDLHAQGIIDDRLFEWAEALREDGNLAAHDLEVRVSLEDATHILDFTEAILEYVFILGEKFQEYQGLRAKRAATKTEVERDPN